MISILLRRIDFLNMVHGRTVPSLIFLFALTLLSGCATQVDIEHETQDIYSPEEAVKIIERALQAQLRESRPTGQSVNLHEFTVYLRQGTQRTVRFEEVSEQELFSKRNHFVVLLYREIEGARKKYFYYRSDDSEDALEFLNATKSLSHYNKTLTPAELTRKPQLQIEPAWPGVQPIIGDPSRLNCTYVAQTECQTQLGASATCEEWHLARAEEMGANGVKLGTGRGGLKPFGLTGWSYKMKADYYLCLKNPAPTDSVTSSSVTKTNSVSTVTQGNSILGEWVDEKIGTLTIVAPVSGEAYLLTERNDGGKSIVPLQEGQYRTGRKFTSGRQDGTFYVIKPGGSLEMYDDMGLVRELP